MKVKEKLEGGPLYDLVLMDFGNNRSVESTLTFNQRVNFLFFSSYQCTSLNPQPSTYEKPQSICL